MSVVSSKSRRAKQKSRKQSVRFMSSPSDDSDHDLCKSFTVNAKECALLLSESVERSSWEFLFKKWLYVHAESILWICVVLFFSTSPSPLHINSVKAAALTSKTLSIKVQLGQKWSSNPNPINTNYFLNWQKNKKYIWIYMSLNSEGEKSKSSLVNQCQ